MKCNSSYSGLVKAVNNSLKHPSPPPPRLLVVIGGEKISTSAYSYFLLFIKDRV